METSAGENDPGTNTRAVETRLRVRYAETDQMGVVYYANYLIWMEIGRTDFCRKSGFRYRDLELEEGFAIAVAEAQCRYRAPARYDDEILVRTTLERLRRRTLHFTYEILNAGTGELLAEGATVHVVIGTRDGRTHTLPPAYHALLGRWESPHETRPPGTPLHDRETKNP